MPATTFREMMLSLCERVGSHHLPVRADACEIHDFLDQDAVHHDLVKRLVRDVYRANRCSHLDASVTLTTTFTALGLIRGDVIRSGRCDVDQLGLLEEIGAQVAELLAPSEPPAPAATEPAHGAGVRPMR